MLKRLQDGRRKYGLKRFVKREFIRKIDKTFFSTDKRKLIQIFRSIGLKSGSKVAVHASMSALGHIEGGPNAVIEALMETVGSDGCIMMPTFSMGGSMASFFEGDRIFDVGMTPSADGLLSEVFRQRKDVIRSLHPTHSVAAWGKEAAGFLCDNEKSMTPWGRDTPYGRLAEVEDSYVLMLETHLLSFLHHVQDRVNFPNLYFPEPQEALVIDHEGKERTVRTLVMRPLTPYWVAIPSISGDDPDWVFYREFVFIFPRRREKFVRKLGQSFEGYPKIFTRRKELEEAGILKSATVGRGEIGLLNTRSFLSVFEPEFRELIERFRKYYQLDRIQALGVPPY